MKKKIVATEILTLDINDNHWDHPNIEEILSSSKFEVNEPCGHITGPLFRFYFEFKDKSEPSFRTVISANEYEIEDIDWEDPNWKKKSHDEHDWEDFYEQVKMLLNEDFYFVNNEQFCFTEIGKQIPNLFDKPYRFSCSPDLGMIKDDNGDWHWDS